MQKRCMECGNFKDVSEFPIRGTKVDGSPSYRGYCKDCWKAIHNEQNRNYRNRNSPTEEEIEVEQTVSEDILVKALAELARNSPNVLDILSKEEFITYSGYTEPFSFSDLKEKTFKYLDSIGAGNPASVSFTADGNYLVIGDTYGMKTRSGVFNLLNNIIDVYDIQYVIAIGRQLDDNDNISNCFTKLNAPVYFIPTADELCKIHKLNEEIGGTICREFIKVGDVTIRNQEQISQYVKRSISSLDPLIFKGNTVVNCTRQEYATRYAKGGVSFIASCGTLAEPHVPKVINKLLLTGGSTVKQVFHHSFRKYRKAEEDKTLWQNGCILLTKHGSKTTPNMLPIKKVEGLYTTACNNTVITEEGSKNADMLSVVVSDIHAPRYNKYAVAVVLSYLKEMSEDNRVELYLAGDILNAESLNHHILSRGEQPSVSVAEELVAYDNILQSFKAVASEGTMPVCMSGNHSDFINRWCKKNPQFSSLFQSMLESIITNNGFYAYPVDSYLLTMNDTAILHGNTDIAVQGGTNVEKIARAFGQAVCGHSHATNMRFGALRIGCLAEKDQGYNSPYSAWDYSIGVITTYKDVDFLSFLKVEEASSNVCNMTDGLQNWTSVESESLLIEKQSATVEVQGE